MKPLVKKLGTSVKAHKPPKTRNRVTLRVQLDFAVDNVDSFLAIKSYLAGKRSWKRYVLDGLRLFYDLKNNSTVVLLELFPNIRQMLKVEQGGSDDETKALLKQMIRNQERMIEMGITDAALPATPLSAAPAPTGKQIASPSFALPVFDDDDVPAFTTQATAINSAQNLIDMAMGLIN